MLDHDNATIGVDVMRLEVASFLQSKPGGIHRREQHSKSRLSRRIKDALPLLGTQDVEQRSCPAAKGQKGHVLWSRQCLCLKKLQRGEVLPQSTISDTRLEQLPRPDQQVLVSQVFGTSAKEVAVIANGSQVVLSRTLSETCQLHVVKKPLSCPIHCELQSPGVRAERQERR